MPTELLTTTASLPAVSSFVDAFKQPGGFGDASLISRRPDTIALLGGIPDASALPVEALAESYARVLRRPAGGSDGFQYSSAFGLAPLREWIARREGVDASRIVITNGGMHGLALSVQALVNEGDVVAVDNPIFPLFLRVLDLVRAEVLPIQVDENGFDVDALERELESGARPTAVYTVADFGNPAQATLTTARRRRLVALAEKFGFTVIVDNPYRELRFRGESQDSALFNQSENVIHVNTFSKTLGPGLRLGWLTLPERLVDPIVKIRNRHDSHTSTLTQLAIIDLLTRDDDWFDSALAPSLELYRHRADVFATALETNLPGIIHTRPPEGGFFLWPTLVDGVDADALAERAIVHGIAYQQGRFFDSGPGTDSARHLRFAYGNHEPDVLREAAHRLRLAYEDIA